jgi:hypothetical protein
MKNALHWLVGYDPQTEQESFELPIPSEKFGIVGTLVRFDDDDPHGIGSYELTSIQAKRIASLLRAEFQLPHGLDFFLEAHRDV